MISLHRGGVGCFLTNCRQRLETSPVAKGFKHLASFDQRCLDQSVKVRSNDRGQPILAGKFGEPSMHRPIDIGFKALPSSEIVQPDLLLHRLRLKVRAEEASFIAPRPKVGEYLVGGLELSAVIGELIAKTFEEQVVEFRPYGQPRRRQGRGTRSDERGK